jgi:uncharacterized RDD family membrane protein YckC
MSDKEEEHLHRHLDNLRRWLPGRTASWFDRLRKPEARWVRIPAALLFICGGFLGFLPILGFWMLPIGVLLLSLDIPVLKRPTARALNWAERRWAGVANKSEGS